ncbi:DCC1-like thiol-disulfide oxidoreductase family protein [Sphingopyxis sp. SE2]|jgi:predicted DCC family thiol-disulfide oxidoreductase YuxK|uniref:thiol-disulfide oxidoreductase DCC family protein n=1 Tax=unclassified Sphingopyxis TaxID=2614943 RepID=UPI000510011B|nr:MULTISPECIES: DCC1-like thiol-disulfide oxidoreductase family protein [unclassified Sphingopyxis]KGB55266.1 Thiol-disulfide oxidoreductase DCC [Sphingopyxis sp. LC363]MDT7528753.1 DCC1-like thiol-disulfide oxidoreductase family protein [Sphingopyxis sp. SE2]
MADGPVILFDAECILCSANARFILRHDKAARFRLASVQSVAGAAICRHNGVDPDDPTTLLLVEDGRVRRDSDAILGIYQGLGFPWALAGVLRLIPAALRDRVYRWIARNRYRFFGKRQSCWIAPPEYRDRIL